MRTYCQNNYRVRAVGKRTKRGLRFIGIRCKVSMSITHKLLSIIDLFFNILLFGYFPDISRTRPEAYMSKS